LHIQDYEIDAMLGLGLMDSGFLPRLAHTIETWFMRRFDRVSTISTSMMKLAVKKGADPKNVIFFPNWVDTEFISPDADKDYFRELWGIPGSMKIIMYSGNMGKKQGLELVLQAALAMRDRKDILFLLIGHGAAKDDLVAQAQTMGLTNIRFEPLQDYIYLPSLLVLPDVHLVVQKKGAADVVLPSKLTGILSAGGHALITAEAETELGVLCRAHPGIGTCVEPESLPAFLDGLERILASDTRAVNTVARNYAEQYLNKDAILRRFQKDLEVLVSEG
jgi:colanic acid biosynthesis glycosyl transferase WcaI